MGRSPWKGLSGELGDESQGGFLTILIQWRGCGIGWGGSALHLSLLSQGVCVHVPGRGRERRRRVYIHISAHTYINIPQGFLLREAQL